MIRLNLGCGDHYAPGWTNIDAYPDDNRKPDVVADILQELPFKPGSVDLMYAGHVLEHLPYEDVPRVLDLWHTYAAPGCQLMVVGPDVDRAIPMYRAGQITPAQFLDIGKRESDVPGWAHLWDSTEEKTLQCFRQTRWRSPYPVPIIAVPDHWPLVSRIGWQFAITATA